MNEVRNVRFSMKEQFKEQPHYELDILLIVLAATSFVLALAVKP
ncbi:hypothetical protein Ga0466249_002212 [Sporomusaceae bacterium BoRhaA]|nr:hypothetical protein [Pelorhabdus rhamnosifermentans]MBU2701101.1 hypothetical protein [Pelorhabdus rhamnosifermentans]